MDLPRQLPERLPRLTRRAAGQNALVHRVARRQRIRRRRHRALVLRLRHVGEGGVVAPDAQRHLVRPVAQAGAEEQVVRRHRVKAPADPLPGAQDVVFLAQQAARLALRQQVAAVLQRYRHLAAADRRRSAADDPIAPAVRPHLHRVARTGVEAEVVGHAEGADRVARRHRAAAMHRQRADAAGTAEDAAALHADVRYQRAVDRQQAGVDLGRAGIGVGAGQHQRAFARLGQAALIGPLLISRLARHTGGVLGLLLQAGVGRQSLLPAFVLQPLQPGVVLRPILFPTLLQRFVADVIAPGVGDARRQVGVKAPQQLPRAGHGVLQVRQAPAGEGDGRFAHLAGNLLGGGEQHRQRLLIGHVREARHDQRQRAGGVRRRGRGAVER
ncbi:Uncharacterised protein [Serratia ficaria]|nr:Uncharacterised protein [Serratia ficaria]